MMHAEHVALFNSGYKEWVRTVCVDKKESHDRLSQEEKKNCSTTL